MKPDDEMMAPVRRLVRFMAGDGSQPVDDVFAADGATIVENFPPFLFDGSQAVPAWRSGFVAHVRNSGLEGLKASFGPAQDYRRDGDRVFFTLPTEWTGASHGRAFAETGGWVFVLLREAAGWRIRSYAWAVTGKS